MKTSNGRLDVLLNDDSFIRWILERSESVPVHDVYWDRWLEQNPGHPDLVQTAEKLLTVPFKKVEYPDVREELKQLFLRLKG